jgi:hypothetical protein
MQSRDYWLDLFTGTTWQEFLDAGAGVSGFRERRWKTVQRIKPGDYLLCYLTGVSRFIGVLEPVRSTRSIIRDTNHCDTRRCRGTNTPERAHCGTYQRRTLAVMDNRTEKRVDHIRRVLPTSTWASDNKFVRFINLVSLPGPEHLCYNVYAFPWQPTCAANSRYRQEI